jgi:hypothetical protein
MTHSNSPAVAEKSAHEGELAARTILAPWKGPDLADACVAALQLGLLSDRLLRYSRCEHRLNVNLDLHKVDIEKWPEVRSAFHQGRDTIISIAELKARYLPPNAANDNNRFDVTWFDDVNQSVAKPRISSGMTCCWRVRNGGRHADDLLESWATSFAAETASFPICFICSSAAAI